MQQLPHTPGPWMVVLRADAQHLITGPEGQKIAVMSYNDDRATIDAKILANADLMYSALLEILSIDEHIDQLELVPSVADFNDVVAYARKGLRELHGGEL